MNELTTFSSDVIKTYGLPDDPSYHQAIAAAIMHLGPLTTYAPKRFFAKSIKKAMANHAAFEKIQSLKAEEKAYHEKIARTYSNGVEAVQEPASQVVS